MKNSLLTLDSVQFFLRVYNSSETFANTQAGQICYIGFDSSFTILSPVATNTSYNHPLFNHHIN